MSSEKRIIRGYELLDELGRGGFGVVYRAHQSILKREVALKAILPDYANESDFIRRFEREAEIVAALEHPYIVPLFDYWREPDGAYLVMRLIRGGSLRELMSGSQLSHEQIIRLYEQIGSALHIAHRKSVIHRDIKPENILLDEDGNAYLTDFGIAKSPNYDSQSSDAMAGTIMYAAPEQIQGGNLGGHTDIYAMGIILYELLTGQHPLSEVDRSELFQKLLYETLPDVRDLRDDLPGAVDDVIQQATAKNPDERYSDIRQMAHELKSAFSDDLPVSGIAILNADEEEFFDVPNPYKGLHAFQEPDRHEFFGRDALTEQLISKLQASTDRFLAVVGPSGSGKSSVVKAGLIPRLREGAIEGSETWFIVEMFPGSMPFVELEAALLRVAVDTPDKLLQQLRDENGIARALKRILPDEQSEVLLVIDQFEELFTLLEDQDKRLLFIDNLLNALEDARSRLRLIVTIRADFYDRPLMYEDLGQLIRKHSEIVLPLSQEELQTVIEKPVETIGVRYETGLIDNIIQDVREQPGILPLLQYALTEMFERRRGRKVTIEAHRAIGGVTGALAKRAQEIYGNFDDLQQGSTRQLFLRLVTLGEGREDTRRRVRQSEIESISHLDAILQAFSDARLLTFDRDPTSREPTLEVAHEALIRNWDKLREWLNNSREDLRIHRRLTLASNEWQSSGNDPGYLISSIRLEQFASWAETSELILNVTERVFLDESLQAQAEKRKLDEERKKRESEIARRAQNFQRASVVLGIVAVIALIATIVAGVVSFNANNQSATATNAQGLAIADAHDANTQQAEANQRLDEVENTIIPATLDAVATNAQIAEEQVAEAQALLDAVTPTLLAVETQVQNAENEITSLQLASRAQNTYNRGSPFLGLVLALQASYIDTPPQTEHILADLAYQPGARRRYEGHSDRVRSVAFSPDGRQILSGSEDSVILWDVSSGEEVRRYDRGDTEEGDWVSSVAFSPDGSQFVSDSSDYSVILWDVVSGEQVRRYQGHSDGVLSVAFSPDGSQFVSGSSDYSVILWDVATGSEIRRFQGHSDRVRSVAFSPDGSQLVSGGGAFDELGEIILWDVLSGEEVRRFEGNEHIVISVVFSPDGRQIVSGGSSVILWDVSSGEQVRRFEGHSRAVRSVAFSPDGRQIVSGSDDNSVILWDVWSGEQVRRYEEHSNGVLSVAFSPDGSQIVSGSLDSSLILWDVGSGDEVRRYDRGDTQQGDRVYSVAFSPDGSQFVSGSEGSSVILWDVLSGEEVRSYEGHLFNVWSVAFSPDGSQIVSSSEDNSVILWDVGSGEELRRFEGHGHIVVSVAFSPDGRQIAAGSWDSNVILWDVLSGEEVRRFEGHSDWVDSVAFSPDGRQIVSGGSLENILILWDVLSGEEVRRFEGHSGNAYSVAFSPDGSQIVSGSEDNSVILWDVLSGEEVRRYQGHSNAVNSVAFSPDGSQIVSGSSDSSVILWDVGSGEEVRRYEGHLFNVWSVAFSPDGRQILSGSDERSIILWRNDSIEQLQAWTIENRVLAEISCIERRTYGLNHCNEDGIAPLSPTLASTRTAYPLPTIPQITFTPIASPTASNTPSPTP